MVGLLQALLDGGRSVSVVVVPTVSLAIDQEEGLRARLRALGASDANEVFAFHSGLDRATRRDMLARIRGSPQRAVFTSPEALFGALGSAIRDASEAGRIGQFVVDEAHLVASWGAEFRPDFQILAGYRSELVRLARRAARSGPC